ncbi:MAG: transcriptional regulator [Myxococcales bacterium]|nr:transcriptional regulator [Myxococcales bacterium]|tara:strand:- start:5116 stop:5409 length:294 start_codon:yes stop_codon:yes gene_type:complete
MSLDATTKKKISTRLKRLEGQVAGLRRMMEEDKACVDVLLQISAAQGALGKVGQILLGHHMSHCVSEAFEYGDGEKREQYIEELLDVFERYGSGKRG